MHKNGSQGESFPPYLSCQVLQVRGVCQYGKLNHYLGAAGSKGRRKSMYPDINFCKNPGAICSDRRSPELRWVTGTYTTLHYVTNHDINTALDM